jgi:hypothetical protein
VKDNSKNTSGGFKDLLKEKCPWHLDGNHTTERCYQLRRALKDIQDPQPSHDKKGKKKADEGNDDFQEPQNGERPLRRTTHQTVSEGHQTGSLQH